MNHEQESYRIQIVVEPPVNDSAIVLRSVATGVNGMLYHSETMMFGIQAAGNVIAYSASNDVPGLAAFTVTHGRAEEVVLTLGNLEDPASFREVITIRSEPDGRLIQGFAWALPGEEMQERSSARLSLVG